MVVRDFQLGKELDSISKGEIMNKSRAIKIAKKLIKIGTDNVRVYHNTLNREYYCVLHGNTLTKPEPPQIYEEIEIR